MKERAYWVLFAVTAFLLLSDAPESLTVLGAGILKMLSAFGFVTSLHLLDVLSPRKKRSRWNR